ncbi:MAG: SgcJ/EcaC family oxidoreductase [Bryobacteraceae bacterium]
MTCTLSQTDRAALEAVFSGMQEAWNRADGDSFGTFFQEDADFVNVYGMHGIGRHAISDAHKMIFRTVYAGSRMQCRIMQARPISDRLALVHLSSRLEVPHGPLAGELRAAPSAVLEREGANWKIVAFHNTFSRPRRPSTITASADRYGLPTGEVAALTPGCAMLKVVCETRR